MDDCIVGNRAAFNIIELYSIKSVSYHKTCEAYVVGFYAHAGVPAPSPDQSTASKQAEALLYCYLVVDASRYLEDITRRGRVYRCLQIRTHLYRGAVCDGNNQQGSADDAKGCTSQANTIQSKPVVRLINLT